MDGRSVAVRGLELAALAVVGLLVVGQLMGQPVLLSYVETGSMAPTMQPGDGFVAIPTAVAGPIEEGDVIVFDADRLHGGGLVTHRVIGRTDRGFVTKGDANPFTDQDGVEPPVQEEQVVAKALAVGGKVVVIPHLGTGVIAVGGALEWIQQRLAGVFRTRALLGTQGLAYLLFGTGVLAYLASLLAEQRTDRRRDRRADRNVEVFDAGAAVAGLTLLLVVVVTASMVVGSGPHAFEVISSTNDAPGARVIPHGQTETLEYAVPSNGLLPVVVFLEPGGDGVDVSPRELYVGSNDRATATVTLTAPGETGRYRRFIVEHRYLALLPRETIRGLYTVHPWLPILAIDALVGLGFAGLGAALVGTGRIRVRRGREVSLGSRIRRWFR